MSDESTNNQAGGQQTIQLQLDYSKSSTVYTNFCHVTATPEEVVLDLGLNAQPQGSQSGTVVISQRLVMSYYTAKRMLGGLQRLVQMHEANFGPLETDVQKRIRPRTR